MNPQKIAKDISNFAKVVQLCYAEIIDRFTGLV